MLLVKKRYGILIYCFHIVLQLSSLPPVDARLQSSTTCNNSDISM